VIACGSGANGDSHKVCYQDICAKGTDRRICIGIDMDPENHIKSDREIRYSITTGQHKK